MLLNPSSPTHSLITTDFPPSPDMPTITDESLNGTIENTTQRKFENDDVIQNLQSLLNYAQFVGSKFPTLKEPHIGIFSEEQHNLNTDQGLAGIYTYSQEETPSGRINTITVSDGWSQEPRVSIAIADIPKQNTPANNGSFLTCRYKYPAPLFGRSYERVLDYSMITKPDGTQGIHIDAYQITSPRNHTSPSRESLLFDTEILNLVERSREYLVAACYSS